MPTLDPDDWQALRSQGHQMLDDMFDYLEHIRERKVWTQAPFDIRQKLKSTIPVESSNLDDVYRSFREEILPFAVGNVHPGFMGWVHGGGTAVGMLAEMLAAGLNANLGGRDQVPIAVEQQITQWMSELFSFPKTASGLFVTGSSMANLIGFLVARFRKLGPNVRTQGLPQSQQLTAYCSAGAHGCIRQALEIIGIGSSQLRRVPVDSEHRLRTSLLQEQIQQDVSGGLTPFCIVGTTGTVDIGAVDPIRDLRSIADRYDCWLHIDGALGALAAMSPQLKPLLDGIELADSIALDFHKWGQVPYDAGFILVRDAKLHYETFVSSAAYLSREERGLSAGSPWPCDFGPDLSRSFKALKTWFTLKTFGTRQLGGVMENGCQLAQYLKSKILSHEKQLELLAPVPLNIVCFRYKADTAHVDEVNRQLVIAIQESGIAAPSSTRVDGKFAIRAALFNHRTLTQDIDALVNKTLELGAIIKESCER